jgi:hypothetical protein
MVAGWVTGSWDPVVGSKEGVSGSTEGRIVSSVAILKCKFYFQLFRNTKSQRFYIRRFRKKIIESGKLRFLANWPVTRIGRIMHCH